MHYYDGAPSAEAKRKLNTKLVLRRKRNADGIFRKYKARLLVYGNEKVDSQQDYFSPVADFTVARLIMCVAMQKVWKKRHYDLDNAFFNAFLDREIIYPELLYTQMKTVQQDGK